MEISVNFSKSSKFFYYKKCLNMMIDDSVFVFEIVLVVCKYSCLVTSETKLWLK